MENDEILEAVKKNENPRIIQLLKEQPSLADARDKDGVSVIFLALYRGNKQGAQEIASRKSELDIFEAAALGNVARLKAIVDRDPSLVKSYSPDGFTALALAAYLGQRESAGYLVDRGAELNAVAKNETGYTALTGAVSQNHNEVAKLLVKKGANVNHSYEGGFTPLMHAAYAGNVELVNLLLGNGADPRAKNGDGKTALIFAGEKAHNNIVELLKKHSV